MTSSRKNSNESRPINLVLLAISFIIFGVLGIVFITQMELQPGWAWEELRETAPTRLHTLEVEDADGNGVNNIIGYADVSGTNEPEAYQTLQYGGIFNIEGSSGKMLWSRVFTDPVRKVFPIMNVNGDDVKDYFYSQASTTSNLTEQNGYFTPEVLPNMYNNKIIDGSNGEDISVSFTDYYVHDLVTQDSVDELILLECESYEVPDGNMTMSYTNSTINVYFLNGTIKSSINDFPFGTLRPDDPIPAIELFNFTDQSHLLFISSRDLFLYNLSSTKSLELIYNVTFPFWFDEYAIIEDLNLDGISELLLSTSDGNVTLVDGYSGGIIWQFTAFQNLGDPIQHSQIAIEEIYNTAGDGTTYLLFKYSIWLEGVDQESRNIKIYSIDLSSQELVWQYSTQGYQIEEDYFALNEDMTGDSIGELVFTAKYEPAIAFGEVIRYKIIDFITGEQFAVINTQYYSSSIKTVDDFDGDGKKDILLSADDSIILLSSRKPVGLWLSPAFPLGLPLFIVLAALLAVGIIILVIRGKRLQYHRHSVKEHKLTIAVNAIAIVLMSVTFVLFLILMNIFNNTLIAQTNNTTIIVAFLVVTITWYGFLPLTAALYNRFAPQFAFLFVRLRNLFFKVSKGYRHDILVLDMEERKEAGITIQLKRLILPLLLSIAVGFYSYDILAGVIGYPKEFEVFGSTEFFNFMMGYMLGCVLPMILSFVAFSFFISGNYLLDDAGIVYFRENKKYRQPGDIEPISIWAQSLVKGIAGLSALLTFGNFLIHVDYSGFFQEANAFSVIFGVFIIIVMFGGIPFLTAFSYILLAGEVMELNAEGNIAKLYKIMENKGYDITPRNIMNIYPSGIEPSKKEKTDVNTKFKDKT